MTNRTASDVEVGQMSVGQMSEQDAGEVFDGIARRELGISGSEFLQRWDRINATIRELETARSALDAVIATASPEIERAAADLLHNTADDCHGS